jgi:hypothetical protein
VEHGLEMQVVARKALRIGKLSYPTTFDVDVLPKIALSIGHFVNAETEEHNIKEQLSCLSYFSFLKSLSPILLGLGIGDKAR